MRLQMHGEGGGVWDGSQSQDYTEPSHDSFISVCFTGNCFWSVTSCQGWMAAAVLPTVPTKNRNQASLKPTEGVICFSPASLQI